jgi:hypothetical protein
MSLEIRDLTTSASCNLRVGLPGTEAKLIIHQVRVKIDVEDLRAKSGSKSTSL